MTYIIRITIFVLVIRQKSAVPILICMTALNISEKKSSDQS